MHRTYLADIERGKRNVTLRTVANLAKALRTSEANLFAPKSISNSLPD
jgi:transcriptional regulator with XRE-family HTH domain